MADALNDEVPSPCVKVCALDSAGRVCVGCFRSLEEIGAWAQASAAEKRLILARAKARKADRKAP